MAEPARSQDIQAVVRAADILRLVSERGAVGVREVSAEVGLDRTTAHRYLSTLVTVGFLVRDPAERGGGDYRLGPFASVLGGGFAGRSPIAAAKERLQDIADRAGSTAVVSVVNGDGVVVADVARPAGRLLTLHLAVGYRVPPNGVQTTVALAHASSEVLEPVLRATSARRRPELVAQLARVRAEGGLVDTTSEGVDVVAVPLFQGGRIVATLAALAFTGDPSWGPATLADLLAQSRELSGSGLPDASSSLPGDRPSA